ncbi:DUF885 domain-containing protein [Allonocardiopsis opalescens]|uniref:Uncharacterized protein (DUF885 family) n=1 Tax=Allonocardiopsis opalescens TaxID=1144618 RepID=A0A2T0Q2U8_9ACTN|nr:DUF885 domain-containing protein [Allonocardiopsis opalescens]PRX98127.1 uncharacterized protein (DUF885 family) [Allonocardiopsis opalescens]
MRTVAELADELLDVLAAEEPLNEMLQDQPGHQDRLADPREEAERLLRERARRVADEAAAPAPPPGDALTLAVVRQQAEAVVVRLDARLVEFTMRGLSVSPLTQLLSNLPLLTPVGEPRHERAFLTRLAAIPGYLAAAAERHRQGVAAGRTPVARRVRDAVAYLDRHLSAPADDPLRRPPLSPTAAAERDRLLEGAVRPAFAAYRAVLAEEIAPHGRPDDRPGLCALPGGGAVYAALARTHTTTGHSPEELHRTGLELMERLDDEFAAIGARRYGAADGAETRRRIRADRTLLWPGAEEVLATARAAIARAERAAPDWFGRLPSRPVAVAATPPAEAPESSAAAYLPGAPDGSRPGTYYANTYLATERDRSPAEANAFHEGVPGHHMQISLTQELTGVHPLRRAAWVNAYMEGWALYSERLAEEMGLYSDDVARLGMLALETMRAARLVVDTGLHALGWSRRQVVEYLRANTVMPEVEVQQETDRYIESPGQALSYMVGRLEIQRLRARAEAELGAAFDIRAFHDTVLGSGPLPMPVLDGVLADWTRERAAAR